jgi:hypothetical protein
VSTPALTVDRRSTSGPTCQIRARMGEQRRSLRDANGSETRRLNWAAAASSNAQYDLLKCRSDSLPSRYS